MQQELVNRSGGNCEICAAKAELSAYVPAPRSASSIEDAAAICTTCRDQLEEKVPMLANHWRCLNDSMWSEVPAVKVIAYRVLNQLRGEGWPVDLLDMMYLDEDTLEWAKQDAQVADTAVVHRDSNGVVLAAGDTVTIIKDLNVKGSSMVAKRGTAVRNIILVHDNAEQIEGKVDGQRIVLLTQYVKK